MSLKTSIARLRRDVVRAARDTGHDGPGIFECWLNDEDREDGEPISADFRRALERDACARRGVRRLTDDEWKTIEADPTRYFFVEVWGDAPEEYEASRVESAAHEARLAEPAQHIATKTDGGR